MSLAMAGLAAFHSAEGAAASAAARERARQAAEQRQTLFDKSAGGRAAHRSQKQMRAQQAADDRQARERVADWNS